MKKLIDSKSLRSLVPHIVMVGVLAAAALLFYNPLLSGKFLLQSDIQQYKSMSRQLQEGRTADPPVETYWIDNAFLGMPTFQLGAQYPADFLQPFYYVTRILPRPANLLFLYLLGGYLLFTVLGLKRIYSLMGACAFGFSTYLLIILQVGHNTKAEAIGYFPFVLTGFFLLLQEKRLLGWLISVLALGMQLRANHYQMTYYLLIGLLLFGLVYLWDAYRKQKLPRFIQQMGLFASAGVLAMGLNATPLLATNEYSQFSTRSASELRLQPDGSPKEQSTGLTYDYITQYSYGLFESFSLLFPRIQGGGSREDLGTDSDLYNYLIRAGASPQQAAGFVSAVPTYWGDQPILEAPAYIGITLFFLALIGSMSSRGPLRQGLLWVMGLSLALSWGKNIPWLTHFLIDYFPLYNKFRAVSSAQVLLELCLPILAIWGLSNFFKKSKDEQRQLLFRAAFIFGALILLLFALKGMLSFQGRMDNYLRQVYGVEIFQQIVKARKSLYNQELLRALLYGGALFGLLYAWILGKLKKQITLSLVFLLIVVDLLQIASRYTNRELFVRKSVASEPFRPTSADQTLMADDGHYRVYDSNSQLSNARTAYFHRSLGGYHGAKPRRLQEVFDFFSANRTEAILNMLNVKYVLYEEEGKSNALINPESLGIAWPVDSLVVAKDADTELQFLEQLDLSRQAVIGAQHISSDFRLPIAIDSSFQISIQTQHPDKLLYTYEAKEDQFVVFSEAYYEKGWKAYIGTEEQPIVRVNYLLRGVWLPASASEIRFEFDPPVVRLGTQIRWVTLFLFLLSIGGAFWYSRQKK